VDRIVVAPGKVATRSPLIVMQPFTTSRILQIDVKAGDHFRKGQVLVAFDSAFAQADVETLRHKVETGTAETERLEAELGGKRFSAGPEDGAARITQAQIFDQEMSDYQAEIKQRDSRLGQIDSQFKVDQASLPGIRSQLEMARRMVASAAGDLFGDTQLALRDTALGLVADAYAEHLEKKAATSDRRSTVRTATDRPVSTVTATKPSTPTVDR